MGTFSGIRLGGPAGVGTAGIIRDSTGLRGAGRDNGTWTHRGRRACGHQWPLGACSWGRRELAIERKQWAEKKLPEWGAGLGTQGLASGTR